MSSEPELAFTFRVDQDMNIANYKQSTLSQVKTKDKSLNTNQQGKVNPHDSSEIKQPPNVSNSPMY